MNRPEKLPRDNAPAILHMSHHLFESNRDGIVRTDLDGTITDVNPAFLAIVGYQSIDDIQGTYRDITPERWHAFEDRIVNEKVMTTGYSGEYEKEYIRADGTIVPVSLNVWLNKKGDVPVGMWGIVRDITERKRAQEALRESELKYRTLFDEAAEGIAVMSIDDQTLSVNISFARMHGYDSPEEMGLVTLQDLDTPETALLARERLSRLVGGESMNFDVSHYHKDGHIIDLNVSCKVIQTGGKSYFMGLHQDITERKRSEEALARAQKLEALSLLAGGIAHDFNNLLCGIFGHIELAAMEPRAESRARYLATASDTITRARALTDQLLTFSKGGAPMKKIENLAPMLIESVNFALSGSNVKSDFNIQDDLWLAELDKNQIGQVIDNIVINAQQAMPEGGVLHVSAKNVRLDDKRPALLAAGDYIQICIRDHGIGMPREILPKIFDPFFTTKIKGHGLGLATSYSIVRRHNGSVEVESEPGRGSTFTIFLPALPDAVRAAHPQGRVLHKGSGVILVMDDEKLIGDTLSAMLDKMGYSPRWVANGKEAIAFLRKRSDARGNVVALVFDLTIPGGHGGKETIHTVRKLGLNIPAFVASGYADDPVMAHPTEYGFTASICKPFTFSELSQLLNRHLNSRPVGGKDHANAFADKTPARRKLPRFRENHPDD